MKKVSADTIWEERGRIAGVDVGGIRGWCRRVMWVTRSAVLSMLVLAFTGTAIAAPLINWHMWSASGGPSARSSYSLAYDRARGVTVLFGGKDGSTVFGDTWEWDGSMWNAIYPPTSPTPRYLAMMTYDEARGEVVLFGGEAAGVHNDTWTWNGTNWVQLFPASSPPARQSGAFAYDAARGQCVLFSGLETSGLPADTWTWDGSNWSLRSPSAGPTARIGAAMAYDRAHGQIVLFGGRRYDSVDQNDTWTWDGSNWTLAGSGISPSARYYAGMAYEQARGEIMMFGGFHTGYLGDTWVWDGSGWSQPSTNTSPAPRMYVSLAYDAGYGEIVLFGGFDGTFLRDTWALQVAPMILMQPASQIISPGGTATLRVDANGTKVLGYQWYEGSAGDLTRPVAGALRSTFTTPPLISSTSYWVRVHNMVSDTDSTTASVIVSSGCVSPSITSQPASQVIASGSFATLSVSALGQAPLSYQWYWGDAGDTSSPIPGATDTDYTTPALTFSTICWVRVSNACGTADSTTADVTVVGGGVGPVITRISPRGGRRGGAVSIYGTGFSSRASSNRVYFQGVRARVSSASATRLRVKVPRRAPLGPVYVSVVAGGIASNIVWFTVR